MLDEEQKSVDALQKKIGAEREGNGEFHFHIPCGQRMYTKNRLKGEGHEPASKGGKKKADQELLKQGVYGKGSGLHPFFNPSITFPNKEYNQQKTKPDQPLWFFNMVKLKYFEE